MKITRHKNGDVSVRFQGLETCNGGPERIAAIKQMAGLNGGEFSLTSDVLKACHTEIGMFPNSVGTDALTIMCEIVLKAIDSPHGQGCMERAKVNVKFEESIYRKRWI